MSLLTLLKPLKWQGNYISCIPENLIEDLLESPFAIIIGINKNIHENIDKMYRRKAY